MVRYSYLQKCVLIIYFSYLHLRSINSVSISFFYFYVFCNLRKEPTSASSFFKLSDSYIQDNDELEKAMGLKLRDEGKCSQYFIPSRLRAGVVHNTIRKIDDGIMTVKDNIDGGTHSERTNYSMIDGENSFSDCSVKRGRTWTGGDG